MGISLFLAWTSLTKSRIIQSNPPTAQISEAIPSLPTEKKQITLMLVGDIMLNRGVELEIKKRDDWNWPFLKIAKKLKEADIAFGNLEGPISDKGAKVGSIYSFRMDPKAIDSLKSAGFDILSLANNHAFDYGRQALKDTYDRLEQAGIDYVGGGLNATEAGTPAIKEVYGTKFAFLAYTDLCLDSWKPTKDSAGINCTYESDLENIKKNIKNAKNSADIVIVSLHSGNEYVENLTPFQINFSKSAIDAGADLVAGHHPHIVQKNEEYFSTSSGKTGYIFYSLGNFVFDQKFSEATMRGLMVKVIVKDKKISEVVPINIKINSDFQPEIETKEKTASSLDITKKILSWGHIATTTPRFIDAIVIHSSFDALGKDPYSVDGVIKEYGIYKVAPHYLISRSGAIYQLAPENNIAYHAGASEMPDTRINVNNFSMGIELIYKNNEEPSQAQYSSLAKLASHLQKKYGIPKNNILGHKDIAPERKTDPWNFDWEKFYKILQRQAPAPQTSSVFLSSEKLKQGDTLNSIKSVFTDGQLPYLLADGEIIEIIDNNLVEYFYVQIIFIGENVIERENESYIVKGDFFTYKLIFSKAVDFSNKNIHGQVLIILGKEYVIDSSSDNSKIVLVSDNKKIRLENGKKAKTKKGLFFRDVEGNLVNLIKGEDGKIISIEIEFSNINGNLNIGDSFSEDVFDKSQGNALDKIKDADEYKTTEGKINHSAF